MAPTTGPISCRVGSTFRPPVRRWAGRSSFPAALAALLAVPWISVAQSTADAVSDGIRNRLEAHVDSVIVGGTRLYAGAALRRFYVPRVYQPAWLDGSAPSERASELVASLEELADDGLTPAVYHLAAIQSNLSQTRRGSRNPDVRRLVDLDLLLTDAFLLAASHLLSGRVNPETIHSEWVANRREGDMAPVLEAALTGGGVRRALDSLRPRHPGYARLRAALRSYRSIAARGGWGLVPFGSDLSAGDVDPRVLPLRRRLRDSGDLPPAARVDDPAFDSTVTQGLMLFQQRHGLPSRGTLDSASVQALNVSAADRVTQIGLNLERWRWLPQELGERHILVNIAAFELEVFERGIPVMTMRVVTGRTYRRTPVFSGEMTYIVLRPYWHVPHNIAVRDKLPLIKRDPAYLARNGYTLFAGWGAEATVVDPLTVDWSQVTAANFPYRLRQDPGPYNALGDVKFMFPNRFNVYLHDTPDRELFENAERDFSSGCIRLQRPRDLLRYLVRDQPEWTEGAIETALAARVERTVRLPAAVPVHILYWTTWADPEGRINFRRDVYERDGVLANALAEPPQ